MNAERKIQLTNTLLLGGALSTIIVYSLSRDPEKIEPQQEPVATSTLLPEATVLPVKVSIEHNYVTCEFDMKSETYKELHIDLENPISEAKPVCVELSGGTYQPVHPKDIT